MIISVWTRIYIPRRLRIAAIRESFLLVSTIRRENLPVLSVSRALAHLKSDRWWMLHDALTWRISVLTRNNRDGGRKSRYKYPRACGYSARDARRGKKPCPVGEDTARATGPSKINPSLARSLDPRARDAMRTSPRPMVPLMLPGDLPARGGFMDRDCALPFGVRIRANGTDRGLRKCNTSLLSPNCCFHWRCLSSCRIFDGQWVSRDNPILRLGIKETDTGNTNTRQ